MAETNKTKYIDTIPEKDTHPNTNRKFSTAFKKYIYKKMVTNYYKIIYCKIHKINRLKKILHKTLEKFLYNVLRKLIVIPNCKKTKPPFLKNEPVRIISGIPCYIRTDGKNSIVILIENIEKNRKFSIKIDEIVEYFLSHLKNNR